MYILLDCRTGGVYAVQDETREEKVVQIFVDRDDAVRYHMMLEESDKFSRKLEIAEVEEDLVKENCVNHGYAYSVISPNDFVIPVMIHFQKIRWKNFLSTGNTFTELNLVESRSTLIVGSNGAGKSTLLDALCFGLFNKPFRKITKPQLVNTINEKECVVEIEFKIGVVDYKVVRGIKPGIFEIYRQGSLIDQDAANRDYQKYLEQSILKLNFKSFTQVVILGSSNFVPFMQLSAAHRRSY